MATVYLGLGSNLGDPLGTLSAAVAQIGALGRLDSVSSVYETEPWGDPDQPAFLNLCCSLETGLDVVSLHRETKEIERRLGRTPTRPWGPRVIDIDLLGYDSLELKTPTLTIPHPRIADRAFVLAPLAEINPSLHLPGLEGTVSELLSRIPGQEALARRTDLTLGAFWHAGQK